MIAIVTSISAGRASCVYLVSLSLMTQECHPVSPLYYVSISCFTILPHSYSFRHSQSDRSNYSNIYNITVLYVT